MIKLRFPLFYFTMFFAAVYMLHADLVFSADQAAPNCMTPCTEQYKTCFDMVKDSPNDIERELCAEGKKECTARCDAEMQEYVKGLAVKELEKQEEKARLEQEEKARLGQYDLTPEEQQKEMKKWKRSIRAEERENEEQEAAPPQEQQDDESLNGIKIYQFK